MNSSTAKQGQRVFQRERESKSNKQAVYDCLLHDYDTRNYDYGKLLIPKVTLKKILIITFKENRKLYSLSIVQ